MSALLALALAQLAGGPVPNPAGPIYSSPSLMGTSARFEAFPRSGRGTTGVCSTTAPTGAKGETLTFTRSSNGTCTKTATGGLATTGIANGDLVSLSSNVARVEYDAQGVLGLLVESSRTNSVLRSEQLDNAAWTKYSFGTGSNPTVTADQAVAPDGTTTADRVQFSAVDGASQSGLLQAVGITTGTNAVSVFVRGVSGSGSIQLSVYSTGACVTCNYDTSSWSRCTVAAAIAASGHIRIGNDPAVCGGGARGAQDVYLWGAQFEVGAYATSYIPTTSAAVTRSAENGYFAPAGMATALPVSSPVSAAAFATTPYGTGLAGATIITLVSSIGMCSPQLFLSDEVNAARVRMNGSNTTGAATWTAGGHRVVGYGNSTERGLIFDGTLTTTAGSSVLAGAPAYVEVGITTCAGNYLDGIISRICVDPDASRCR